ncbi:MAG TPA: KH domain-containing protein [Candidatus Dojkabacteria bacterium]|nr:KH domain-containing protein [Candidatus Dojkabacteria bacterium]
MKELVEYIVKSIVNNPDEVEVSQRESVDFPGLHIVTIKVSDKDLGALIGKKGRTIHSIRDIVTIAAIRANKRVRVVVHEEGRTDDEGGHNHNHQEHNENTQPQTTEVMSDESVEETLDL